MRTHTHYLPHFEVDDLPVEPELVAPVLAVERPEHVLLVGLDDAVDLRFLLATADLADDLLVELVALRRGDVDEDLRASRRCSLSSSRLRW